MWDEIVEFLQRTLDIFGITFAYWHLGCIGLGVLLLITVLTVIIVKSAKKRKAKRAAASVQKSKEDAVEAEIALTQKETQPVAPAYFDREIFVNEAKDEEELLRQIKEEEDTLFGNAPVTEDVRFEREPAPQTEFITVTKTVKTEKKPQLKPKTAPAKAPAKTPAKAVPAAPVKKETVKTEVVKAEPVKAAAKAPAKTPAKKEPAKAPAKTPAKTVKEPETVVKGKYVITKTPSGQFVFSLRANNGVSLYESTEYASEVSCKNAIPTFKKYVAEDAFEIVKTEFGDYSYIIKRPNGTYNGKPYSTENAAKAAVASVQKFYDSDNIAFVQKR